MEDADRKQLERLTEILNDIAIVQTERDALIRKVLAEGTGTVTEVMEATGLSKPRIYQIRA